MSNREAIQSVWNGVKDEPMNDPHKQSSIGVDTVLKNALLRRSLDNVSVVIVGFQNFVDISCHSDSMIVPGKKAKCENDVEGVQAKPRSIECNEPFTEIENKQTVKAESAGKIPQTSKASSRHFDFSYISQI
jgi:hypothetical protein